MTKEALTLLVHEMEYVLSCINEDIIPFDGDDFHEALRLGKEALAQEKALQALHDENERLGLYKDAYAEPERESKRLQCVTCGTVYADGVPPKVAQPKQEKERCFGCEACIDTACGRDECPKGWPKAAQPEQEPVARIVKQGATVKLEWVNADSAHNAKVGNLYTTPPQRTWVGLTTDDWDEIRKQVKFNFEMTTGEYAERVSHLVEDKLREKNT